MNNNGQFLKRTSHKNIIISYLIIICFISSLISSIPVKASAQDKGDLCSECNKEAIEISSFEDLEKINDNLSGCYKLTDDIDCSNKDFAAIDTFKGHFDGNYHKIENLNITGSDNVGLFNSTDGAVIKNLGLENAKVTSSTNAGVLVGSASKTSISNCYVTGSIEGSKNLGGITGYAEKETSFTNCYSILDEIKGDFSDNSISAIVGSSDNTVKLENCYTAAKGQKSPICGYNDEEINKDNIKSCYYDKEYENNTLDNLASLGKTSEAMKNQDTYVNWDFNDIWEMDPLINNGYPYIKKFAKRLQITPGAVAMEKGSTQNYSAILTIGGEVKNPSSITWNLVGNNSSYTTIDNNGTLKVSLDETSSEITINATAKYKDTAKNKEETEVYGYAVALIRNTTNAETPKFGASLKGEKSYVLGDSNVSALRANASVSDGGTLSYQWYKNKVNNSENGEAIDGATESTYIPKTDIKGISYYYVVVTNTNENESINGSKIVQSKSDIYTVNVADIHNITYNLNGGSLDENSISTFNELMDDITLSEPQREGYIFDGWYTDDNFVSDKVTTIKKGTSSDVTLYAKWSSMNKEKEEESDNLDSESASQSKESEIDTSTFNFLPNTLDFLQMAKYGCVKSDIDISCDNKLIDSLVINNDDLISNALKNTDSRTFYNAISFMNLSKCITIGNGTSNGDEYTITSSDSDIVVVSELPLNSINTGSKSITTKHNQVYINGIKSGNCIVTLVNKTTGAAKDIKVTINSLSERMYIISPQYTDGYLSYFYINGFNKYTSNKPIKLLTWNFTPDNGAKVQFVKLSNGDIVLYNQASKFTGTLSSTISSTNTPISQKVDSNLLSGEDVKSANYPKNTLKITETYKMSLKLTDTTTKNLNSKVEVNAYLLKNGQVKEHLSQTYNGNVYKNNPELKFNFNTEDFGKLEKTDTLKVVYEVTSDKFKPQYIEEVTYSNGKLENNNTEAMLEYGNNTYSAVFKEVKKNNESNPKDKYILLSDKDNEKNLRIYTSSANKTNEGTTEISIGDKRYNDNNSKSISLEGMKYTWIAHDIKLNNSSVKAGVSSNISIKFKNRTGKLTSAISSDFKVVSTIGIPEPEMVSALQFFGGISAGEFSNSVTGKVGVSFQLPTKLSVQSRTATVDNNPLTRTFAMLIGYGASTKDSNKKGDKDQDFSKTLDDEVKKIKEGKTSKGGSVNGSLTGYAMGTINYVNGKWVTTFSGGGITGKLGCEYGISRNMCIFGVPVYFGFKVGLSVSGDVLIAGKNSYHDLFNVQNYNLVLDAIVGVEGSLTVEGGIGFDAKVAAMKFGAEGELKIGYKHRVVGLLQGSSVSKSVNGGDAIVQGSLKLQFQFKILWFKYKKVFAEKGFKRSWTNGYRFPSGRPNGLAGKGNTSDFTYKSFTTTSYEDNVEYAGDYDDWSSNVYPYASPVVSRDGSSMALLYNSGDMNDTKSLLPSISYKSDDNFTAPEPITGWGEDENVASSLDYDGNSNMQTLAFSASKYTDNDGSDDKEIENSLNSSEIYVTTIKDGNKVTKKLTNDNVSDTSPVVYANGNKAVVLWQKGNYDIDKENESFGYKEGDSLWYSVYDGNSWSEPAIIQDNEGINQSYDVAMTDDGTVMALASKSKNYVDDLNSREMVQYLIKNGNVTKNNITNDEIPQTQPRLTTYNYNDKDIFVAGYMNKENPIDINTETSNDDNDSILNIQGFDTDGNIINSFKCQSNEKEVTEKYDFVKSDNNDLAVSWIGYEEDGKSKVHSKIINETSEGPILSKEYVLNNSTENVPITNNSSYLYKDDNGNKYVKSIILQQVPSSDDTENDTEKAAFIKEASAEITNKIQDLYCDVPSDEIAPNNTVHCDISFTNASSDKIKALVIESDNQVQTVQADVNSGEYGNVTYNYSIGDEIKDAEVKVTPILESGQAAEGDTTTIKIYAPNLLISEPQEINTESGGIHTLRCYILNIGTKKIDTDYIKVSISENEDIASDITTDSIGAEVLDDKTIKISGKEAMNLIDNDLYELTFKHKVTNDSYNINGTKAMMITAFPCKSSDDSYIEELDYAGNVKSFGFIKPSLTEGEQFSYDITQDNSGEVTKAKITITNNYEVSKESNFKVSLLDEKSNVIESKVINLSFSPQEEKEYNAVFNKSGYEVAIEETSEEATEKPASDPGKEYTKDDTINSNKPNDGYNNVTPGLGNNSAIVSNNDNSHSNVNSAYNSSSKETGNNIPFGLFLVNIACIAVVAGAISKIAKNKKKFTK